MTRVFDAPRSLVWEPCTRLSWSSADVRIAGLGRFVVCENDPRWRHVSLGMHGPGGVEMKMSGVYREVVPPERGSSARSVPVRLEPRWANR